MLSTHEFMNMIPNIFTNIRTLYTNIHNSILSHDFSILRPNLKRPTIAEAAIATDSLSTLVAAVKAAGLVDTLNGEGSFTVFAPNNEAFAKIPESSLNNLLKPENVDQLRRVLLRHVLPTINWAGGILKGNNKVKTVGGEMINVIKSKKGVSIESSAGRANVIAADIRTANGVVHIVDTVF